MSKVVFSSDQLQAGVDDAQRFALWRDLYSAQYGLLDFVRAEERPFAARLEFAQFGPVAAGWFDGALARARRTRHELKRDARDELFLFFNCGRSAIEVHQRGRELLVEPGMPALLNYYEAGDCRSGMDHAWMAFTVERHRLQSLVRNVEDLVAVPLDPRSESMAHLRRYAAFLAREDAVGDAGLAGHIGHSLLDLIALAIGANAGGRELMPARGIRGARLRAVLGEIEAGFDDMNFSLDAVARRLRFSPRYIQDLLHESGDTFTGRVLELRLQKARRMLADPRCDGMVIGDIAALCGFGEAAYFTRRFRRRFETSPTAFRAMSILAGQREPAFAPSSIEEKL